VARGSSLHHLRLRPVSPRHLRRQARPHRAVALLQLAHQQAVECGALLKEAQVGRGDLGQGVGGRLAGCSGLAYAAAKLLDGPAWYRGGACGVVWCGGGDDEVACGGRAEAGAAHGSTPCRAPWCTVSAPGGARLHCRRRCPPAAPVPSMQPSCTRPCTPYPPPVAHALPQRLLHLPGLRALVVRQQHLLIGGAQRGPQRPHLRLVEGLLALQGLQLLLQLNAPCAQGGGEGRGGVR
jgi:hypothetical protein